MWKALADEPILAELVEHPSYQAVVGAAAEYTCGRFNVVQATEEWLAGFNPFGFTLCCEACFNDATGELDGLLELCQKLQSRETELMARHLLERSTLV